MDNLTVVKLRSIRLDGRKLPGLSIISLSAESGLNFSIRRKGSCRPLRFCLEPKAIESVSFWLAGDRPFIQVTISESFDFIIKKICQMIEWSNESAVGKNVEFWLAEEFLERKEDETKLEKLLVRLALEVNRCQPGKLALEGERPANSQLDLSQIYRDFPSLPTEIWAKIISFLTWPERMKVERVCRTWRTASKASWSFQKKIEIDERFDSHKKVSALLERCGLHLEEIWTRQNLPQPYGGELLGQLCPNLKRLAFGKRGSFVHTEVSSKVTHENLIYQTDRLFTSFCQLERLEFYSKIETWMSTASNVVVLASDVIRSLINVPSLQELHIFDENSETDWSHLADLQQLKILSISVDSMADAVGHICRLVNLRQIFLNCSPIHPFTVDEATKIGKSLPNLESLIIASVGTNLKISLVPSVIQEFSALRTFLFVSDLPAEEQTIVDLRPFSQRQPPINVFVDSRVFHLCSGESDNVRLINLPYTTNAAAIHFLQLYNQNGFDIKTQFCLMMMSRDREAYGAWNSEIEMDDDLHSDISGGPMDPYLIDEFEDFDDVEEDENSDVDYEDWDG